MLPVILRTRAALLAVACLILAGCSVNTKVDIGLAPNGTGTVHVTVDLDAAAVRQVPDLQQGLRTNDLTAAGWEVGDVADTDNGGKRVTASHDFGSVTEANAVIAQLTGPNGAFKNVVLTQDRSFLRTTSGFTGAVDLTNGVASFGDATLAQRFGSPLGFDVGPALAANETSADKAFPIYLTVDLPGSETRSPTARDGTWTPTYGTTTVLEASSSAFRLGPITFLVLAGLLLVALIVVALVWKTAIYTPRHAPSEDVSHPSA